MKNIVLIIFTLSILTSCQIDHSTDGYLINVTAKNIPDSTKVLMYLYPKTDIVVDSTIVIGEKFQFKGKIERPRIAMLRIESTKDTRMFWLENHKIDIAGKKGDLKNSKVVGSGTQKEAEKLLQRKGSIFKEMEKLEAKVTESNRDSLFVIYEKMQDVEIEINKKFIRDYPDSFESLTQLNWSKERLGSDETSKVFSQLNKNLQSTEEGKLIKEFITKNKNLKVGDKYIDFEQPNIDNEMIKVSNIKGKYTLLEFWASWCGPCRGFNPELVKEYELYKDKGFVIIGISLDSNKEKWITAVEKDNLIWENICDLKGSNNEAAMIYGVRDIPDNFLIDENGVIIARYIRGDNLKKKLKKLFEDKAGL